MSVWDLESTINSNIQNKVWWCRGWEKWVYGEDRLIDQAKMFVECGGRIIVNSSWLVGQFKKKCGVDVDVCYSGLDIGDWVHNRQTRAGMYTVGGMVYRRHDSKRSDQLDMLSQEKMINKRFINIKSGLSNKELVNVYGSCDMWVSPTGLEGFHQTAAEAGLCGCLIVCNRLDSNGMGDYATDETAMRYTGYDEMLACIRKPDFSKVEKMREKLLSIGDREKNMRRFTEMISA